MSVADAKLIRECSELVSCILMGEANHIDLFKFIRSRELERVGKR